MKRIDLFIAILVTFILTSCTNQHCCFEQTKENFSAIGGHISGEVEQTQKNFSDIYSYVGNDISTSPGRIKKTAGTMYEPINFADTSTRLAPVQGFFLGQIEESIEETPKNLKAILQALCLSK